MRLADLYYIRMRLAEILVSELLAHNSLNHLNLMNLQAQGIPQMTRRALGRRTYWRCSDMSM